MLSDRLLMVSFLLLGFSLAGGFIIHTILGAVRRLRELPPPAGTTDLHARLARIETSLDALRHDMDRLVAAQRIAERPDFPRLSGSGDPPRTLTPH